MFPIDNLIMNRFLSSLDAAEALKETRQYIKAARSMGAVMQLSRYFDKYKEIESVGLSFRFLIVSFAHHSRLPC